MKSCQIIKLALVILLLPGCFKGDNVPYVYNVMCENMFNPHGIATVTPGLSWKIGSGRNGSEQKAYQILAASDLKLLNESHADLWNTGKVNSPESIFIRYKGAPLKSGSLCFWKVRIWDENGEMSGWSEPATFSIGLLESHDWKGEYIGLASESENCESPQLRKTFYADSKNSKIFLHVNSLGYHEIWLNGHKAGENVLAPAVSQFSKRSLTVTYDVSDLIKKGRNDLIIWIGQGWYSKGLPGVVSNGPLVRAQIESLEGGESRTLLYTDSTWTGRASGYSTTGTWRPGRFGGEQVDGSQLLADLSAHSIDDADWIPVRTLNVPEHEVSPQMTEPNRIIQSIKPDSIYRQGERKWIIDMGKTLTGWFEIHFPLLEKGQEIIMEFSDHLDKDGNIANQGQKDIYRAGGNEGEIFKNKFNYHGYRFVKISNLEQEPVKDNITGLLIRTGYRNSSSFECSDNDLNRIHDMISYTLECLSIGGYLVDCPTIERLGYGGDGNASTETAQIMFDLDPLYSNWFQAWADCIREDGSMPHTAPNPYSAGGGPYWCGFIITAAWRTYRNYGDLQILEKYYPVMQKWLEYVDKYTSGNLLKPWPETDYRSWYLGDWATPEGVDQTDKSSVDLVNNCFITVCYETMSKIALLLGRKTESEMYSSKRESVIKSINSEFLDNKNFSYGSGSQIDLTYPLLAGIVPDSLKDHIRERLLDVINVKNKGHIACGLVGVPVFTEWAVLNHEADLVFSILKKKDYPGYLYMVGNGATTTWEHWNGARSRIHNCYNGIGSWFYQAPGGILNSDTSPGYRHVMIDPQIPKGVSWANTTKETPYGPLTVSWRKENKSLKLELKIPVGCTASVKIPDGVDVFIVNGKSMTAETSYTDIKSGNYLLDFKLTPD